MKKPLILLFFSIPLFGHAQHHNNIWCFGLRAGLDFNQDPPTAFVHSMVSQEGCASISDPAGQLMFYSNSNSIWDRTHTIMPNGDDILGGLSSTQAVMIVPWPGNVSKYFVFTTLEFSSNTGLYYSIVDMTLNNGFGDVVPGMKNVEIVTQTAEKLTWAYHANGKDLWILTHKVDSDEFLCYLLTSMGLSPLPVVSKVGTPHSNQGFLGPIKVSHTGNKIVTASTYDGILEMFDFDQSTGIISNPRNLNNFFSVPHRIYGIEFSPNDSLLYLSSTFALFQTDSAYLYQLEPSSGEVYLLNFGGRERRFGAIQMAINSKVYMARVATSFIDLIHHPNTKGPGCEYIEGGQMLLDETEPLNGLPQLIPYSYYLPSSDLFGQDQVLCEGESLLLEIPIAVECDPYTIEWSDGSSDTSLQVTHSGTYWVKIESACGPTTDTIQVLFQPCEAIVYYDLELCQSYMHNGTNMDYSEFDPAYPTEVACATVTANHAERISPQENKHSCTPGVNGTVAMCISALSSCEYLPGHTASLIMEILVQPHPDSTVVITGLDFYEKSPETYSWIDGGSGPNNFPTLYGVRILRDGTEIYRQDSVATTTEWTLQTYRFLDDSSFLIDDTTVLRIELLPYCPTGNGASVSAWDVDEIHILGGCAAPGVSGSFIEGRVYTVGGRPVSGAEMILSKTPDFSVSTKTMTDANGTYRFESLTAGERYYLKGHKDNDLLYGVSVLDLLALRRHLLGLDVLKGWPAYIAADIDRSRSLTIMDLVALQKALLGILFHFPNNTSWRFGYWPQDISGEESASVQEVYEIESLGSEGFSQDFIGIKIGDLTGDARSLAPKQ